MKSIKIPNVQQYELSDSFWPTKTYGAWHNFIFYLSFKIDDFVIFIFWGAFTLKYKAYIF